MKLKLFAATALLSMCSAAQALVIDFNSKTTAFWLTSTTDAGFSMVKTHDGFGTMADATNYWNGNGTARLLSWTNQGTESGFTLTQNNGLGFSLQSFEFGNGYTAGNGAPTSITLTGVKNGATLTKQIDIAGLGIHTHYLDSAWSNLSSARFVGNGSINRTIWDNITVNETFAAEVPEPASLGLLALAALGLAAARRRK